jgi:hypothetical protein
MYYKSYQHIEKLGTSETEGILNGQYSNDFVKEIIGV